MGGDVVLGGQWEDPRVRPMEQRGGRGALCLSTLESGGEASVPAAYTLTYFPGPPSPHGFPDPPASPLRGLKPVMLMDVCPTQPQDPHYGPLF